MPGRPLALAAAVVLVATLAPAPGAAHEGHQCDLVGLRLEGECYHTPDESCDDDLDQEHTRPYAMADASGGWTAFIPNTSCSIHFEPTDFPESVKGVRFRAKETGSSEPVTLEVRVFVDGTLAARGAFTASQTDPLVTESLEALEVIPPGPHIVRITYRMLAGVNNGNNLFLDYVEFEPACPSFTARFEAECYTFTLAECNPDADYQHLRGRADAAMSNGFYGFLPNDGCGFQHGGLTFDRKMRADDMLVRTTGGVVTEAVLAVLYVDGTPHAVARVPGGTSTAWAPVSFATVGTVAPGTHRVTLRYTPVGGSLGALDLHVDHIDFAPPVGLVEEYVGV